MSARYRLFERTERTVIHPKRQSKCRFRDLSSSEGRDRESRRWARFCAKSIERRSVWLSASFWGGAAHRRGGNRGMFVRESLPWPARPRIPFRARRVERLRDRASRRGKCRIWHPAGSLAPGALAAARTTDPRRGSGHTRQFWCSMGSMRFPVSEPQS